MPNITKWILLHFVSFSRIAENIEESLPQLETIVMTSNNMQELVTLFNYLFNFVLIFVVNLVSHVTLKNTCKLSFYVLQCECVYHRLFISCLYIFFRRKIWTHWKLFKVLDTSGNICLFLSIAFVFHQNPEADQCVVPENTFTIWVILIFPLQLLQKLQCNTQKLLFHRTEERLGEAVLLSCQGAGLIIQQFRVCVLP